MTLATGSPALPRPLERFLRGHTDVLVVRSGLVEPPLDGAQEVVAGDTSPVPGRHGAVLLRFADATDVRRSAGSLPPLGRSKHVAVWLDEVATAPVLRPRPEWPVLDSVVSKRSGDGGGLLLLEFDRPVLVSPVLAELARQLAPGGAALRPALRVGGPDAPSEDVEVPPDVLLSRSDVSSPSYGVTGRPAVVVTDPVLRAGPLDERLLNPVGFVQRPPLGPVALADLGDVSRGATPALVARAGQHSCVQVDWAGDVPSLSRVVAGLTMAGIPMVGVPPASAEPWLGSELHRRLADAQATDDLLVREEQSVLLRRAAHGHHASYAWERRVALASGLPVPAEPTVSVLLATKRPELLDFALAQVARQHGADIELVLVAHGFAPDLGVVRQRVANSVVVSRPEDELFGEVLQAGLSAASGDLVVKMDDDDWYGPDFLTDLVMAQRYSGAEIVGTTAEYVYLEQIDRTIRRADPSETYGKFVAGGTMMMRRDFLQAIGGFRPVRRFVDRQLLDAAIGQGAHVYRVHGLGYVLRRRAGGHTWDAGVEYFLDAERLAQQWDGFRPSRLVEEQS